MLSIEGVVKRFGALTAVDGVSFSVRAGERVGLIGPNGAGKSTLFAVLAGAVRQDAGRIDIDGRDVGRLGPAARARLGLARSFQRNALFDPMTVAENLALADIAARGGGWRLRPGARLGEAERVAAAAAAIGLAGALDLPAAALSYGDKRRLEIGLALIAEPRLLLLDEPAAGMGREETAGVRALLAGLPRDLTLILVEHDLDLVFAVVERLVVLAEGRVVFDGPPAAAAADEGVRAAYLGPAEPGFEPRGAA